MYYLIYTSYAVEAFTTEEDLSSLLIQSGENNARLNITGMLYYFRDSYMQLIEGGEKEVTELYQKISADKRHKHSLILKQGYNEKRFFPDWTMGYKYLTEVDPEILKRSGDPGHGLISTPAVLKLFNLAAKR